MFKIISIGNGTRQIAKKWTKSIRKYGCDCPKPEYECPHKKQPTRAEIREQRLKSIVHPFLQKDDCKQNHSNFWRLIFFGVCVPSLMAGYIISYHITQPQKRPPFLEYRHLRIRHKPYPWGDGQKSLFHNPRTNALPTGYETEDEDE